ncbi:MAG: IPT/TIG domain-containing protein [bacterium]
MPTVITSTVKPDGTGDYLTLQAWIAAKAENLITADHIQRAVVYSGGNLGDGGRLLIWEGGGCYSDFEHYWEIVVADGHEHQGAWDTDYAYLSATGNYAIHLMNNVLHIRGLQVQSTSHIACYAPNIGAGGHASGFIADQCILRSSAGYAIAGDGVGGQTHKFTHCQIVSTATGSICVYLRGTGSVAEFYNCTLIEPTASGSVGFYVYDNATITSNNNYIHAVDCYQNAGAGGTLNQGANDATSTAEATTEALRSVPFDVTQFVSVTGDYDLHIIPGSTLRATGADLSASIGSYDLEGDTRPEGTSWDIGADEMTVTVTSVDAASGPEVGGTAVTVYGTNFTAGSGVTFGGAAATDVTVVSATEITCTTPVGAVGTADVVVTGSGGEAGTLAAGYEYEQTVTYPALVDLRFRSSPLKFRRRRIR